MHRVSWKALVLTLLVVVVSAAALAVPQFALGVGDVRFVRGGTGPLGLRLGLDLQGGSHLVYEARAADVTDEQLEGVVRTIERRINAFGVAEATVQRLGERRVVVQLPGIRDVAEAKRLIGETAKLEFKERTCEAVALGGECVNPTDKDIGLSGDDLADAWAGQHPQTGEAIVNIQFNQRGTRVFADLTTRLAGDPSKRIAIFLDDRLLLDPTVDEPIPSGTGFIRGGFTPQRARTIAIQLDSGRLPVPLGDPILETTVDATLGQDSLQKSLLGGMVGFVLVVAFMVAYYRVPGLVAAVALGIYVMAVVALFKLIPVTLTLAGIAAFILSIGMAVDANILIFERMKEELRGGRTLGSAVDMGFSRAWQAIRDSNVATFIITAVLYWFGSRLGTPLVVGFAVTLFIGVATSMFTAIVVSRTLLFLVAATPLGRRLGLFSPEGYRPARRPVQAVVGGS